MHAILISLVMSTADSFLLICYPFRRRGISTKTCFIIYSILFILSSFHYYLSYSKIFYHLEDNLSYSICLNLYVENSFTRTFHLFATMIGLITFVFFNLQVIFNLTNKRHLRKISTLKAQFAKQILLQTLVLGLPWLTMVVLFALPYDKSLELIFSYSVIILLLFIVISTKMFILGKHEFKNFILDFVKRAKVYLQT